MEIHTCNPSTWEVEAGRSGVEDQLQPHGKFEASLSYLRPCPKKLSKVKNKSNPGKLLFVRFVLFEIRASCNPEWISDPLVPPLKSWDYSYIPL